MPQSVHARATHRLRRRNAPTWVILGLACVAQFMVILDVSVVNVALPSIGRDLHYSPVGLQWVVNAYVLTFAGFLLLGGRAADLYGRRRIFLAGLGLFVATSLLGGFAQSAGWLTTARALQGIGGAALSPATLTIIVTTFSGRELARALGVWSAMGGAGGAAGVLLGGVLTAELSWRWVLFINIPIGLATAAVALVYLGEARGTGPRRRLDVPGAVTVTAGLAALVYAIVGTDQYAWGSAHTVSWLAVAVVLLGAFLLLQLRGKAPLMPLRLFRFRAVTWANVVMLIVGAAFFSMWYFLSLYLQDVLAYGPLRAGLAFLPMGLAIIVGAQLTSRIMPRTGARLLLLAGTALVCGGFLWLSRIGPDSHYWGAVLGPGVIISFSLGVLFTPLVSAATTDVDRADAGLASGLLNTSRQVGGSLGLAVLATVASSHTRSLEQAGTAAGAAMADGFARAFLVACVLGLLAFAASSMVPSRAGRTSEAGPTLTAASPRELTLHATDRSPGPDRPPHGPVERAAPPTRPASFPVEG
jgi:EmrB/QacA subfamily drug resistance transporter